MTPDARTPATPRAPIRGLLVAAGLLAVQALAAIGFALVEATQIQGSRWVVGVGTSALMVLYGAFLLLVARGLIRSRRWSRGPAVATQLLHLPIAWSFAQGATWWVALVLGITSLVALVCLVLPSSTAALVPSGDPHTDSDRP